MNTPQLAADIARRVPELARDSFQNNADLIQGLIERAIGERANLSLSIRLERDDTIPAFAAFLRCEAPSTSNHIMLLNVQAVMAPHLIDETGQEVPMTREDRKRLIITSLMHEFGHALEAEFNLPVNEEHIERVCADWEEAYTNE